MPRQAALVALVAALLVPSLSAESGVLLEDEVLLPGGGAHAWRVVLTQGGRLGGEVISNTSDARFNAAAVYILRADDLAQMNSYVIVAQWFFGVVHLGLPSPVGSVGTLEVWGGEDGSIAPLAYADVPAGEYFVVAFAASDGEIAARARVFSRGIGTIVGTSSGVSFIHPSWEFEGGINIYTSLLTGASVVQNASLPTRVTGSLFGWFLGADNLGTIDVSVDTPTGPLVGERSYSFAAAQPGAYTFRINENVDTRQVCLHPPQVVCAYHTTFVVGADVRLP